LEQLLKLLSLAFVSSLKFAASPFAALGYDLNYIQTFLTTTAGGIFGVLFFFYGSKYIVQWVTTYKNHLFFLFGVNKKSLEDELLPERKKIFTWKNKLIVTTVRRFGLVGIALLTPTLLSIPVGTLIAARYFRNPRKVVGYLCASVVLWSLILSSAVVIF
jgi:hypothetical protein